MKKDKYLIDDDIYFYTSSKFTFAFTFKACFVDVDTANLQATQAYEKADFKKVKTVKDGTVIWMIRTSAHD